MSGFDPNLMSALSSRSCNKNVCDVDDNSQQPSERLAMIGCTAEVGLFTGELSSQAQTCSQLWEHKE
jgi:hypothetical protein